MISEARDALRVTDLGRLCSQEIPEEPHYSTPPLGSGVGPEVLLGAGSGRDPQGCWLDQCMHG